MCKLLKPYSLEGFEPWIFCTVGGRDDYYALPRQLLFYPFVLHVTYLSPIRM
jgi:hypothetical protein